MAGDFNTDFGADYSRVPYQGTLAGELTFRAEIAAVHGVSGILVGELTLRADFEGRTEGGAVIDQGGGGRRRRRYPPIRFPVPEKKELPPPRIEPVIGILAGVVTLRASFEALAQDAPPIARPPAPARATLAGQVLFEAAFEAEHTLPIDAGLNDDEDILILMQAA